ncbi:choice-of-anchor I family protein [Tessaracoccus sp. MC1627]|uniref:choice-of-anchor I family protein n=1 Tax=Tessaracoccus sp. MC1627 TaxID=2760312 RepID=UPI0015FF7C70|nr:choice-of-anchor I family protein [Tessaracoccus sp. MC1627]MBB1511340.1 choice-of-anchor I family protein [Tessaracoccus sp. MC1627]
MTSSASLRRAVRLSLAAVVAGACVLVPSVAPAAPPSGITLDVLGTYASGGKWDESAAEIVAFDKLTARLFVVNAEAGTVDGLDASDPSNPVKVGELETPGANSVAVSHGLVAVAEAAEEKHLPGSVIFFDARTLAQTGEVAAGALPDMVTFTPNGKTVLVANEGEPEGYEDGQVDPEGSVTVIDVTRGAARATARTADFSAFTKEALVAEGVPISGPGATAAQDLEPEYIAVDKSGHTAYVTLQENNAMAIVDIRTATVTDIVPLGLKDHSVAGSGLDASDEDDAINIAQWPVKGLYMPDAIAAYTAQGKTFTITANEGDAREYDGWVDEARIKELDLASAFENADSLQEDENLGRLAVVTDSPNVDGVYSELWSYGARSITSRDASGALVWDSGDALEQMMADFDPGTFNGDVDDDGVLGLDNRSDAKGPEPEGVTTGRIGGHTYAFVGLERASAIVVFDVTNPTAPVAQGVYRNAGDFGPEGLLFIPASDSPTHSPLLVVGNEVSGTTTVWQIS